MNEIKGLNNSNKIDYVYYFLLGVIYTRQSIDYETHIQYKLTVTATDKGSPRLFSSSSVNININDLNDNTPTFADLIISVAEDKKVTDNVGKLIGDDRDSGDNGKIDFKLLSGNVPFTVSQTGDIIIAQPLDRETQDYYKLSVRASDNGTPALSKDGNVIVRITDVNDNDPEFAKNDNNCNVFENSPKNTHVCYLTATDKDLGENSRLKYTVSPSDTISINQVS